MRERSGNSYGWSTCGCNSCFDEVFGLGTLFSTKRNSKSEQRRKERQITFSFRTLGWDCSGQSTRSNAENSNETGAFRCQGSHFLKVSGSSFLRFRRGVNFTSTLFKFECLPLSICVQFSGQFRDKHQWLMWNANDPSIEHRPTSVITVQIYNGSLSKESSIKSSGFDTLPGICHKKR